MFNRIVVGVRDRRAGRDAIALAATSMARDATITLAHVLTSDPYLYPGASAAVAKAERTAGVVLIETANGERGRPARRLGWVRRARRISRRRVG
jgi:hypothetical protein